MSLATKIQHAYLRMPRGLIVIGETLNLFRLISFERKGEAATSPFSGPVLCQLWRLVQLSLLYLHIKSSWKAFVYLDPSADACTATLRHVRQSWLLKHYLFGTWLLSAAAAFCWLYLPLIFYLWGLTMYRGLKTLGSEIWRLMLIQVIVNTSSYSYRDSLLFSSVHSHFPKCVAPLEGGSSTH